ncbi:helix-turn-helix domain-containing protein [Wenyingzhuangia sp. IMCC45574]
MKENIQQIPFNSGNSKDQFDLLKLRNLIGKKNMDHSPLDNHQINFYLLLFITSGTGTHSIDFKEYDYKKGTVLSIRKDQIHKFHELNKETEGYVLLFTNDFLIHFFEKQEVARSLQIFNELITSPKIQLDETQFSKIYTLTQEIEKEFITIKDEHSIGIIRSFLHIVFRVLFRVKSKDDNLTSQKKYLSKFLDFQKLVEAECFTTKKVNDYADKLGVSTKTLNNITHEIIHKSAKQFIDEVVLTQIKRLLINTNLSVKEIGYTSGFEEPTNLYKFFKRQTKTTPENFRKQTI